VERVQRAVVVFSPAEGTASQVVAVGLKVVRLRSARHDPLAGRQPRLHGLDNARGDLVLDGEDVGRLAIEAIRPELIAARRVGELRRDAQPAPRRPHAALEDVIHRKRPCDRSKIATVTTRAESGGSRRDAHALDGHERVHDLFGHPFAEVLLVLRRTHVGERQHGDRHGGGAEQDGDEGYGCP